VHQFLKYIFGTKFYMFRTVPLSIIRGFSTVHTAMHTSFSQIHFWNKILHVSDSSSVHLQGVFTVHTAIHTCFSQIHFWNKTLHVSDSSFVHHQEFFTVHTIRTGLLTACKLSANLYDIHHCYVYSEKLLMMDRGTVRNM